MSLDFLPLPVFTVLFVIGGTALLWHSYTSKNEYTIVYRIGVVLVGLAILCLPILRYYRDYNLNSSIENTLLNSGIFTITVGVVLMYIGLYHKNKDDPKRRRRFWASIIAIAISIFVFILVYLWVIGVI